MDNDDTIDIGFLITKPPLESRLVESAVRTASAASNAGKSIGFFLMSDGIWLAKKGARNPSTEMFSDLLSGGAGAMASKDHLLAAGIPEDDLLEGVEVTGRPYPALVDHLMERWNRVVVV